MQITSNYSVYGFRGIQNLKNKENSVSAPNFKAATENFAKVGAATLAAAAGVVVKNSLENNEPKITYDEHRQRAQEATKMLNENGISDVYEYMMKDLSYMTGKNFENIVNDFVKMHEEVENGHPITADYVDSKINEMVTKYNLPENAKNSQGYEENVKSEIRYVFVDNWKHVADYKMAIGVEKGKISRLDMRKKTQPDEKVLARFDDLLTRVGEPTKVEKLRKGEELRYYKNKYGQDIEVYVRGEYGVEEELVLEKSDNKIHKIKKAYYTGKDFDEISEKTNGAYCGLTGEGMSGITEIIREGNKSETIHYDDWGIPESKITTEKTEEKETKNEIHYAGDGSILTEKTEIKYLK